MNEREKLLVAHASASALELENAQLRATITTSENDELKAVIAVANAKTSADKMYVSMIRRRAKTLVAKGRQFDAILLLKTIGE